MRVSGKERFTLTFNLNAIHWQIVFRIYIHFFRDNEILYCYIALNAMRGSFFPVLLCEENEFEFSWGRGSPPPPRSAHECCFILNFQI